MVATTNKKARFCNNNQVTKLDLANITYSSQLASFPFANTRSDARFRAWKPAGFFEITATNNLIYINDGSNKTATIAVGNYTYSTLATEIATKLNAVSANFSSSYSLLTRKFTIENTGSVTLRETQTANAAWGALGYTDDTDHTDTSFEADESRNHTSEFVIWDLGAAKPIDFFSCIGFVGENFTISASATLLRIQGNNVNDFSAPPISIDLLASRTDAGIFRFEDDVDMNYRYWKFEFIDLLNTVGPEGFSISDIYLGDYDTLTSTNISRGLTQSLVDQTREKTSDAGSKFFRERVKFWKYSSIGIVALTQPELLEMKRFFQDKGISKPFYISIDPTLSVTTTIDEMTLFVRFDGSPNFNHLNGEYFNMSFGISEVV